MKVGSDFHSIPMTSVSSTDKTEITKDLFYYTNQIVNVIMIGNPDKGKWVLVDTGLPKCSKEILKVAEGRFGKGIEPLAIVLTHGHFDHVGNVVDLLEDWNVPVFAHRLEFPYLCGKQDYPKPDATVEGGLLAKIAPIYPHKAIDISEKLLPLPENGEIPYLSDWKWIHTPGHSPGQIALFRERDRALISGDAFITVRQDSFYKVLIQKKEVNGPPRYLTTDWHAAYESVKKLQALQANIVIPGHGSAMAGEELKAGLNHLVDHFEELAVPKHGKFV